jgi:hypothetical protein
MSGTSPTPNAATISKYYSKVVSGTAANCPATLGGYNGPTAIATAMTATLTPIGTYPDGQYTICALAVDQANNQQAVGSPSTYTWYKETTAPTVSITSTNPVYVKAAVTPSVSTAANGQPGSVATCAWTGNGTNGCAASYSPSNTTCAPTISVSSCAGGVTALSLTLTVTNSGGTTATAGYTVNWDSNAPTVSSISSTSSSGSYNTGTIPITVTFNKSVTVTGTPTLALNTSPAKSATYASGSPGTALTFNYAIGATDNTGGNLDVSGTGALALAGGTIVDQFGNNATLTVATGQLSTKNIVVDTTAPTLAFVTLSLPATYSNVTSLASQNGGLGVGVQSADTTQYQYALAAGSSCGSYGAFRSQATAIGDDISGYADGLVTLCGIAKDAAGNVQAAGTSYTWTKDTAAPSAPTLTGPDAVVYASTPTVTWSASTDTGTGASGVAKYALYVGKASDASCGSPIAGQSYTNLSTTLASPGGGQALSALPDGGYTACMYAYDTAGNVSSIATRAFQVETDVMHLSYTTLSGGTSAAKYAKWSSGSWASATIRSAPSPAAVDATTLSLSSGNVPWVAYDYTDGAGNYYLLDNNGGGGTPWSAEATVTSSATTPVGLHPSLALDSADNVGVLAQSGTTAADKLSVNYGGSAADIDTSLGATGYVNDAAVAVGTNDTLYYVYSIYNATSTHWELRFRTSASNIATRYETVPVDASCTDAMKATIFIKPGANDAVAVAYACVTSLANTPCKAFYVERGFNSTIGPSGAASATWTSSTLLGTMKATCDVATLTGGAGRAFRPSLAIDRQAGTKYAHVAWYDATNAQIASSSNESGSWATEYPVTSLGGAPSGFPALAVDATGHSYIGYLDGGNLRSISNNNRSAGATTGGWNAATTVVSSIGTSVGNLGLTGLMGRSNNANK